MNAVLTLLGKEISLFLKDKVAFIMAFIVPFLLIAIVGMVFGNLGRGGSGPSAKAKIAVYSESDSAAAQKLIAGLEAEESLRIIKYARGENNEELPFTEASLRAGIEDHHYNFALLIPADFLKSDDIGLKLKLIYNPKNDIETQMVNGLMQKAIFTKLPFLLAGQLDAYADNLFETSNYSAYLDDFAQVISKHFGIDYEEARQNVSVENLLASLQSESTQDGEETEGGTANAFLQNLVEIEKDQVFGKEISSPDLTRMVGGYALMFLLFSVTASAASLFEEKNQGIFSRLLSMPVKRHHILWSKYLFNTLLGVLQTLAMFFFSSLLFDVDIYSNFLVLVVVALFAASACTAFGMCLASISKTPAQAQGLGTLFILSMSSLGGAWWPLSIVPPFMQAIAKLTIVYWGIEGFTGALWEQASLLDLAPTLGVILIITLALNALSIWRFKVGQLFN